MGAPSHVLWKISHDLVSPNDYVERPTHSTSFSTFLDPGTPSSGANQNYSRKFKVDHKFRRKNIYAFEFNMDKIR